MKEELNLKEIIEVLWKGKFIILIFSIVALIISGIYSFVIADPVYRGSATISLNSIPELPDNLQPVIAELTSEEVIEQLVKSPEVLSTLIEEQGLDESVDSLRNAFEVKLLNNANISISVALTDTNKEKIVNLIDRVTELTKEQLIENIKLRLEVLADDYQEQIIIEEELTSELINEYNTLISQEELPALLLMQANTPGGQYILVDADRELIEEFKNLKKTVYTEFIRLNTQIEDSTNRFNTNSQRLEEINNVDPIDIVNLRINEISETTIGNQPIAPNKSLNLAVALFLGVVLGVMTVYIKNMMQDNEK
ncbi:Wzz/FepE/Etk N-terminal domain-containing protein [Globicatella sulfidifaciens]|uniref:Capsular polysaccharide biosynthesis protein CpsC n=1 Tax=Globicatella sulfidifaciens TaxID=136093 RepID=A0A7X8H0A0_9LACT|nr:Wzz/FepE/Etk N-terminal domain-containing protein [Globicatella sulfidifaciens]NLJ18281.1 hypothetical protein [Globicatella sulfidifaciens]